MRGILTVGLLFILGQLLVPPRRVFVRDVGDSFTNTYVVRYLPLWSQPRQIIYLRDSEGGGAAFTDRTSLDAERLLLQLGITAVVVALLALMGTSSSEGRSPGTSGDRKPDYRKPRL